MPPRPSRMVRALILAVALLALAPAAASALVIEEWRSRGDTSPVVTDEFVEIMNDSAAPVTVQTSDGSVGYALVSADGVVRFVIPNGTVIPAGGSYLAGGATYALGAYGVPDTTISGDLPTNTSIALFRTSDPARFSTDTRIDASGFASAPALYREGSGFPSLGIANIEGSFSRRAVGGAPRDTDVNQHDFRWADTNGTELGSADSGFRHLGAPGPEGLASPRHGASGLEIAPIDPSVALSAPPNRTRDNTADAGNNSAAGTISLRRTITNRTTAPITRLRLRTADTTTFPDPAPSADLRTRSSTDVIVTVPGGFKTARGTTLEIPPAQAAGGGHNSSLVVPAITSAAPLAPGASIDIQILIGVMQTGRFRFCTLAETLPIAAGGLVQDSGDTQEATRIGATACGEQHLPGASGLARAGQLAFGSRFVGAEGDPQTTTIVSTGDRPLRLADAAITGPAAGDFSLTANGCPANELPSRATCDVSVAFKPTAAGSRTATLRLFDRSGATIDVALEGTGADPPPPPPVTPPAVDVTAPVLSTPRFKPSSFAAAASGASIVPAATKKPPVGSTLSFTVDEPATVVFTIEKATTGRRVGTSCVKPTKSNSKRKACTRYVPMKGTFSHVAAAAGTVKLKFRGRLLNKALRAGRYQLVAVATDVPGNTAAAKRAAFRILPR